MTKACWLADLTCMQRTSSICMDSFRPDSVNGMEDVAGDGAAFRLDMQLFTADQKSDPSACVTRCSGGTYIWNKERRYYPSSTCKDGHVDG